MYANGCVYLYVCVCISVCLYVFIYIYIYIYEHLGLLLRGSRAWIIVNDTCAWTLNKENSELVICNQLIVNVNHDTWGAQGAGTL